MGKEAHFWILSSHTKQPAYPWSATSTSGTPWQKNLHEMHGSSCKKQKFIDCNQAERLSSGNLIAQDETYAKINKCHLEKLWGFVIFSNIQCFSHLRPIALSVSFILHFTVVKDFCKVIYPLAFPPIMAGAACNLCLWTVLWFHLLLVPSTKTWYQAVSYRYCFFLGNSKTMYPHPNRFSPFPYSWLLLPPSLWQLFWKHWHSFLLHYDQYKHKKLINIRNVTPKTIFTIFLPDSFRSPIDFTFHHIKHQLPVLPIKTSWDRILVTLSHLEKVTVTSSSGAHSVTWTSTSPTSPCLPCPPSPLNHWQNFFQQSWK